jgi:hypothetical protein
VQSVLTVNYPAAFRQLALNRKFYTH